MPSVDDCSQRRRAETRLTSDSLNNSGMNPRKKQPTNIATDIKVTASPPSMATASAQHSPSARRATCCLGLKSDGLLSWSLWLAFICGITEEISTILPFHVAPLSLPLSQLHLPPKQHPAWTLRTATAPPPPPASAPPITHHCSSAPRKACSCKTWVHWSQQ